MMILGVVISAWLSAWSSQPALPASHAALTACSLALKPPLEEGPGQVKNSKSFLRHLTASTAASSSYPHSLSPEGLQAVYGAFQSPTEALY